MSLQCPACRSSQAQHLHHGVSGAPEADVYRCQQCALTYLHPMLSPDQESAFYETDFPGYMEVRSGLTSWRAPDSHFQAFLRQEGVRRIRQLGSWLRPEWDVLELGSATGYLLELMGPFVNSVTGLEPGQEQAEYSRSRGQTVVGRLEDLGERKFDAILFFYVLEHIRQPVEFLEGLKAHLKPGGQLYIEVPNVLDGLLSRYEIPAFAPFYYQTVHCTYFEPQTLERVLERAGYQAELIPVQRYDLSNHMIWMRDGRPGGMNRFQDLFDPGLEAAYAEALKRSWRCDTVLAVARPA